MTKLIELREKQAKLVADAREKLETITDETTEARAKEVETEYDALMADHDRIEGQVQRMQKLEDAEERMNAPDPRRPKGEDRAVPGGETPEHKEIDLDSAFRSYLRSGMEGMNPEERRALKELRAQSAGTNSEGGFTVPQGFEAELITSLKMWGPMLDPGVTRQIVTASGNQIDWPTMDDTSNKGAILAENTADSEQDVVFAQKQLDAFKYTSKIIRVSEELLQDSAFDIESVVRDAMAERLGRAVNEHLTVGTGDGQPNGIVTASNEGTTAAAAALTFDDMIDLYHSVDPAYRMDAACSFMFNDTTLSILRKLKDAEDNYIWQPANAAANQPATILGEAYAINQDMPDVGAENRSVVFGAMNRYVVRRVREFVARRLVERYAEFYQAGFLGFARYDGELVDTRAVKHLVHGA